MAAPDSLARNQILSDYERDAPRLSEIESWCENEAKELGGKYTTKQIRKVIVEQAEFLEGQIVGQIATRAERFASMLGATHALVIQKLIEKTDCTKPVVVNSKDGDVIYVPDNIAQIQACRELNQILGAYKPEEIKIDHVHDVSDRYANLTEAQLKVRIAELAIEAQKLIGNNGDSNGSGTNRALTEGDRGTRRRARGEKGAGGPVVLDDAGYQDGGRAGKGPGRGPV